MSLEFADDAREQIEEVARLLDLKSEANQAQGVLEEAH